MVVRLSKETEAKLYGDEAILRYLALCEDSFRSGNRLALFEALTLCARFQAVIPEWAADAILDGEKALESGVCKDFNQLFGDNLPNQRARRREARIQANIGLVAGMLMKYRCDGGSLNAEEAFGEIAEKTGLPRREVEEIYKRHGSRIKEIQPGNPDGANYLTAHLSVPRPRRYGRSIL
jgi:hypothetical protein